MAAHTWYFHTETTLSGAPAPPAGSLTLSQTIPDQGADAGASITSGHTSTANASTTAVCVKPAAVDGGSYNQALPPTTNPPAVADQFGWFSDTTLNGTYTAAAYTAVVREDDGVGGLTGNPVINLYASRTRDFTAANMRFLAQLNLSAADWWQGLNPGTATASATPSAITLKNEYLFAQLWCLETAGFSGGNVHHFHQEGTALADAARSNLVTSNFLSDPPIGSRGMMGCGG